MSLTAKDFPLVSMKLVLRAGNESDITEALLPFLRAQRLADLEAFTRELRTIAAEVGVSSSLQVARVVEVLDAKANELDALVKELRA